METAEYSSVWAEGQNLDELRIVRDAIRRGETTIVAVQPGDGTKYRILFYKPQQQVTFSDRGRDVYREHPSENRMHAILLDGLGSSHEIVTHAQSTPRSIRMLIDRCMHLRNDNPRTREALAEAVYALTSDNYVIFGDEPTDEQLSRMVFIDEGDSKIMRLPDGTERATGFVAEGSYGMDRDEYLRVLRCYYNEWANS